jgi:hypothetical protein
VEEGEDPMAKDISNKEQKRRIDKLKENTERFVREVVLTKLRSHIQSTLRTTDAWRLTLDEHDQDKQTILFSYPQTLQYNLLSDTDMGLGVPLHSAPGYIQPSVRLEFGARGGIEPHETKIIRPYAAEIFPELLPNSAIQIPTLAAERTFWEKVTILHALHYGVKQRDRSSRHYYDTFMMAQKGVLDLAFHNTALLEEVVLNKSLMFKDSKASYETAKLGSLRLIPKADALQDLKTDYQAMQQMFMEEPPDFSVLMTGLEELESIINRQSSNY